MGKMAGKRQTVPILPANAPKQNHIKIRLPKGAWKWMLPLAAAAIIVTFNGCANKSRQTQKEVNEMENSSMMLETQDKKQVASPKNTMKLTPVKTEGREKRDSLLKARINELAKKTRNIEFDPSGRNIPLRPKKGTLADVVKETDFIGYEQLLCHAGIDGDTAKISKYKFEIRKLGKQYAEQERAEKIISNFEKIIQIK